MLVVLSRRYSSAVELISITNQAMSLSNKLRKGEYVTGRSSSGATVQIEYDVEG
jgi:hypothetical protein